MVAVLGGDMTLAPFFALTPAIALTVGVDAPLPLAPLELKLGPAPVNSVVPATGTPAMTALLVSQPAMTIRVAGSKHDRRQDPQGMAHSAVAKYFMVSLVRAAFLECAASTD
jgi:hypothetical protein